MNKTFLTDRISGMLCLLLGLATYLLSSQFPSLDDGYPGPGLFPSIIGGALALSGVLILVKPEANLKSDATQSTAVIAQPWRIFAIVALMIIAFMVAPIVGLLPIVAAMVFLAGMLAGVKIIWAAVTSLVTTTFIYVIFTLLLGVPI